MVSNAARLAITMHSSHSLPSFHISGRKFFTWTLIHYLFRRHGSVSLLSGNSVLEPNRKIFSEFAVNLRVRKTLDLLELNAV
jgi:hypothetical protein